MSTSRFLETVMYHLHSWSFSEVEIRSALYRASAQDIRELICSVELTKDMELCKFDDLIDRLALDPNRSSFFSTIDCDSESKKRSVESIIRTKKTIGEWFDEVISILKRMEKEKLETSKGGKR